MNNNQWYYLPPYVQTTITKMIEFGFTYEGIEEYCGWGNFQVEGWEIEFDEGDLFDEEATPLIFAIWLETNDSFSIPLCHIDLTIDFNHRICKINEDELSFDQTLVAKQKAADLIRNWQRSHYCSPGQLELFPE